jgi:hypothetical protein
MSACMDTELIQPRLATDLFRSQTLAVKREADASTFRRNCVRSNPNILVWMCLSSKNVYDFVQAHVLEDGTSYREVTMAVPVAAEASSKRKR